MKNVIIPADFSSSYANTVLYALKLMQGKECNFVILPLPVMSSLEKAHLEEGKYESIRNEFYQRLQKLQKNILQFFPDENYSIKVYSEAELEEVKHVSLVITTNNILQGSHSQTILKLIKSTGSPLLFIPADRRFSVPKKLFFSLENNLEVRQTTLKPVKEIFGNCSFDLEILKIYSEAANPALEARDEFELSNLFDAYHPKIKKIHSRQTEGVLKMTLENDKVDLNVIPLSPIGYQRVLKSPQVKTGIRNTSIPLIIIHSAEKEKTSAYKSYRTPRTKSVIES